MTGKWRTDGDLRRAVADRPGRRHSGGLRTDITALHGHEQVVRLAAGFTVEFLGQHPIQQSILPQRCRLVTADRMEAHEILMRELMAGLDPDQLLCRARVPEVT